MPASLDIEIHRQVLTLLPHRAVWWAAERALIVSDVHAGKAAHFRKAGLAIPKTVFDDDLARLDRLLQAYAPARLIATGDLFHSVHNREVSAFGAWRRQYTDMEFDLVRGNHDILSETAYAELGLRLYARLALGSLAFRHHPPGPAEEEPLYCLCGHLHPGIELRGAARQQLRLPCFYFAGRYAILPAFSRLTGLALVHPVSGDRVFAIAGEDQVLAVKTGD